MDANIVDLEALFKKPVSYRIPQFQRAYAWKEDSQWKPLWEDISGMADRELKGSDPGINRPHFMGAIVLQSQDNKTGEVEKRIVVDGQQRLTTLQLLIKAAEDAFRGQNDNPRAARLHNLTLNEESNLAGDEDNDTKIRQSNRNDQTAFQRIVRNSADGLDSATSISSAFEFFKKSVADWLRQGDGDRLERADALERAITKKVLIAAIDLDKAEEPHIIFETLNERGESLTQADRIKNTVLYKAKVTDDAQRARELWGMFENAWWRRNSSERRLTRTNNDRFLNYWLEMKTGDFISSDRVAGRFRDLLKDPDYSSIEAVAGDIRKAGVIFKDIEEEDIPEIRTFWRRANTLELGVVTPVLLWLCTSEVTGTRLGRTLLALESYLVRRMLCGLPSMGLRLYFANLLQALENDGPDASDATVIAHLSKSTDNQMWPNDRILEESLTTKPLRGNARRQTMVLEAVELGLRTDKSESVTGTGGLTLEHIMPKNWDEHWPLDSDNLSEARERRNEAVKELGNLTLVNQKLNSKISNGPWHEKKGHLHQHSTLFLNKTLLDDAPDNWDEDAILERSRLLARQIIRIWPHAAQL